MMFGYGEDAPEGTTYLSPQEFRDSRHIERQFSANDSGIVEFVGPRNGFKMGSAVANDCYSDPENLSASPRILYPVPERKTGHVALCTQFSYPMCTPPSQPTSKDMMKTYEDMAQSQRNKDDPNLYTSIDDTMLLFQSSSSSSESKTDSAPPVSCSYRRQLPSRQASVDPTQAAGRANILYEPPVVVRSKYMQRAGKIRHISRKTCIQVVFYLLALAAFVMACVNILSISSDTRRYEKLNKAYGSLKTQNEDLKQSTSNLEKKFNALMKTLSLNDSLVYDEGISMLMFRLLKNDSRLQQRLFEWLDRSVNSLTANISSEVEIKWREQLKGLMPVDMSQCKYYSKETHISTRVDERSTDECDFNDKFLLRAFCTTDGGNEASLEYNSTRPNIYKCTCRGKRGQADSRACTLHYWACPYL